MINETPYSWLIACLTAISLHMMIRGITKEMIIVYVILSSICYTIDKRNLK